MCVHCYLNYFELQTHIFSCRKRDGIEYLYLLIYTYPTIVKQCNRYSFEHKTVTLTTVSKKIYLSRRPELIFGERK
jgi:hypothetical protein